MSGFTIHDQNTPIYKVTFNYFTLQLIIIFCIMLHVQK